MEEGAGVDVVYLEFAKAEAVGGRRKPVEVDPQLPNR
jgi:hypothetical protein